MSFWANAAIRELQAGRQARLKPRGHSMKPKVCDGDEVLLDPSVEPRVGDVVLVKVSGRDFLHLIRGERRTKRTLQFLIGNNRGGTNGWTSARNVYGVAIEINGRRCRVVGNTA